MKKKDLAVDDRTGYLIPVKIANMIGKRMIRLLDDSDLAGKSKKTTNPDSLTLEMS